MTRTLEEIRQLGLTVLRERLGRADTVRFIQQFTNGHGDYSKERHKWADQTSLADIQSKATAKKKVGKTKPGKRGTRRRNSN